MITRRGLLSLAPAIGLPFLGGSEVRAQVVVANSFGVYMTHETTPEIVAQLTALPCEFVQLHLIWSRIGYRSYDWEYFDSVINPLAQSGKRLMLMVGWSPIQKERGLSGQNLLDADGNLDYEQVVALEALLVAAMRRYPGSHIWMWEEEPDGWPVGSRGAWGGKHAEFMEVVRAFARARDATNDGALLALPPVARENWAPPGERPTYDMDWLAGVAALGAFDLVNAWGCNYYAPGFDSHHGWGVFPMITKVQQARNTLPSALRSKPLVVNTGHVFTDGVIDYRQESASYLTKAAAHLWAAPYLHGLNVIAQTVFCYPRWSDLGGTSAFGFVDFNNNLLPAFAEFQRLCQTMPTTPRMATHLLSNDQIIGYDFSLGMSGSVRITWNCSDQDGDGTVNSVDVQSVASRWRQGANVRHIMQVSRDFGRSCP